MKIIRAGITLCWRDLMEQRMVRVQFHRDVRTRPAFSKYQRIMNSKSPSGVFILLHRSSWCWNYLGVVKKSCRVRAWVGKENGLEATLVCCVTLCHGHDFVVRLTSSESAESRASLKTIMMLLRSESVWATTVWNSHLFNAIQWLF